MTVKSQRIVASELPFEHYQKNEISKTYFAVADYYKKYPNPGACHLVSSIFHVLLNEQNINNDLCIGEVKIGEQFFDHSWIEINGEIFDIAIQLALDGSENSPVYAGYELLTNKIHNRIYGSSSHTGLDRDAKLVKDTPFITYMNNYPHFKDGAWKIVKDIAKEINIKVKIEDLKLKYAGVTRIYKF